VLAAIAGIAAATALTYPLKRVAPVSSLSVIYLPLVLAMSILWGFRIGLVTALFSVLVFEFFHFPPVYHLSITDSRNLLALVVDAVVAAMASGIAELARVRTQEGERRRAEADLAAAVAQKLLAGADTRSALPTVAHQIAQALALPSATLEFGDESATAVPGLGEPAAPTAVPAEAATSAATLPPAQSSAPSNDPRRRLAFVLRDADGRQIGTLWVPRAISQETRERLRERVVPTLQALLAVGLRRDQLLAEEVTTQALRRSDEVKTALLRAVSHDLRTPLTAIVATGHALGSSSLDDSERRELAGSVVDEGSRLADLVQKLLDLSRLQAGSAAPHREWTSVEELVTSARDAIGLAPERLRLSIPADLPDLRVDAAQLERVFANLLSNAARYAPSGPVSVGATTTDGHLRISVTDQGEGIPPAELPRIFEPFYRGRGHGSNRNGRSGTGSGLGLAIARGFTEANGGTLQAVSLPGQGTTFVLEFPL